MATIRATLLLCAGVAALIGGGALWPWLDGGLRLLLPLALAFGLWCEIRRHPPLDPRLATGLTVIGFFWYALQFSRTEIVAPAVHLLALLLALRLTTEKSGRNLLQLFLLSLLSLAASSLYSLSAVFLFLLVAQVICVACGLLFLCAFDASAGGILPPRAYRPLLTVGLGLPLVSLALVPPLFFILPRTQTPLWNFLNRPEVAVGGLADRIEPGSVSSLGNDRRVALRVESSPLPATDLYWRAIVLNTPDGRGWVRRPPPPERDVAVGGRPFEQTIYLEPRIDRYIPTLDPVTRISGIPVDVSADGLTLARRNLERRQGIKATSLVGGAFLPARTLDADFYLSVPQHLSTRVRALGASLAGAGGGRARLDRAEDAFARQGLTYSKADLPGGDDPLDDFLFGKRSGYCEHFATAFVTVLRLAGVPSRLVGGYLGGEYSELGGYYIVTEEQAHVWVEALVEGGWERVDPTRLAKNAEAVGSVGKSRIRGVAYWIDAAGYYWNRLVITYDLESQVEWLRETGKKGRQWRMEFDPGEWGRVVVVVAVGGGVLFLAIRGMRSSREERLLKSFLRRLRRRGVDVDLADLGVRELAERSGDPAARDFADRYCAIVFGGRRIGRADAKALRTILRRIR